jgi:hypothetical protein
LFHGSVGLLCTGWAVVRLRALALKQSYGKAQKVSLRRRFWGRPAVGSRPMLWKEIFVESGLRFNALGRIIVIVLVVASFIPVIFIFDEFMNETWRGSSRGFFGSPWEAVNRSMNIWVRVLGSMVACLMLLAVGARASSSISNERDRQTIDALLTSPLDSNAILFGKWIGNVLSVRWAWLWLGVIYLMGLFTGGLHPLALPLLLGAWLIYAFVVSGIGLWFSMVSRTTLRATIWSLLATVGAGVGHWLVWMCCIPLYITIQREPTLLDWFRKFQVGLTPPLGLGVCFSFCRLDFDSYGRHDDWPVGWILYGLLGVVCWIVAGTALALVNANRFRVLTGRMPVRRPQTPDAQDRIRSRAQGEPRPGLEGVVSRDVLLIKNKDVVAVEDESSERRSIEPIEKWRPERDAESSG